MTLKARAYAKINLGLLIVSRRTDGYHDIQTVFHRVDVFDDLQFSHSSSLEVLSSQEATPSGESNLCYKAALLLQKATGYSNGAKIVLTKRIPVGAGLGGGSSDAAATLRTLQELWGVRLAKDAEAEIARTLGSDVPYFLKPGTALGTGRGEILEYFPLEMPYHILVCNPGIHVSTASAYDRVQVRERVALPNFRETLLAGLRNTALLQKVLVNDLEECVFPVYPAIQELKVRLLHSGAVFALMSGSGSTVYGLFSDKNTALAIASELQKEHVATFYTAPSFQPMMA